VREKWNGVGSGSGVGAVRCGADVGESSRRGE
jgi:hypothetical protein